MPEPPHLAPLNAEEQRFYSEPLPDDWASHPISKRESLRRKPSRLYSQHCGQHFPTRRERHNYRHIKNKTLTSPLYLYFSKLYVYGHNNNNNGGLQVCTTLIHRHYKDSLSMPFIRMLNWFSYGYSVLVWQRHSTTHRPGICTTAFWVVSSESVWTPCLQRLFSKRQRIGWGCILVWTGPESKIVKYLFLSYISLPASWIWHNLKSTQICFHDSRCV